jgi:hypothetical protein
LFARGAPPVEIGRDQTADSDDANAVGNEHPGGFVGEPGAVVRVPEGKKSRGKDHNHNDDMYLFFLFITLEDKLLLLFIQIRYSLICRNSRSPNMVRGTDETYKE